MNKPRIFSGIQPSGNLHLGNYLGAIQNWVALQDKYDSIFCVVDMHAITVPQDPKLLKKKTLEIAKIYLAAGIDPKKCAIFVQSHIAEHAELCWILNTITSISELEKMTQFKSKSGTLKGKDILEIIEKYGKENLNQKVKELYGINFDENKRIGKISTDNSFNETSTGLLDYPVLMAADILLYDTEIVPVGKDQKQHIELARDLAKRFNQKFKNLFVVPRAYTKPESENIMGLDNPNKKMSKSATSEYNYIALTDDAETVRRKIKKAVTDSGHEIVYRDEKPALKNLINIYSLLTNKKPQTIEKLFIGKGYADFKAELAEVIIKFLQPLQKRMATLTDEKVLEILQTGADKVRPIAQKKLTEVKKAVGFLI